ncbi:MAG: hypothetical protein AAFP22_19170 [Planctomycetota bacterium]
MTAALLLALSLAPPAPFTPFAQVPPVAPIAGPPGAEEVPDGGPPSVAPAGSDPDWAAVPPTGGRLEVHPGTRVLHLNGPSIESRGFAEGYLLADDIFDCFGEFALDHVTGGAPVAWDLVVRPGIRARFAFGASHERWAEAVVRGMAAARGDRGLGLGVPDRDLDPFDVLACAAIPDLAGVLCSSLAVWGDSSASGDVLVGRNLDYPSTPAVERASLVEVHAPLDGAPGWIGVGWPGSAGCLTGLSERGVYAAVHDVYADEALPKTKATPRTLILETLLTELAPGASTAEEALRVARTRSFVMAGNVMVAWQANERPTEVPADLVRTFRGACVLEIGTDEALDAGVTLRRSDGAEPWIACSNDFRARSGADLGCRRYAAWTDGVERAPLQASDLWRLADDAGMTITLYRTVADLGAGTLSVERHTGAGWQPRWRSRSVAAEVRSH